MYDVKDTKKRQLRLAIVGCGTVAEFFHAPALRGFGGFSPVVMVDHQIPRAELLASFFPGAAVESDFTRLAGRVDAAIVALPSQLNSRIATELLRMGVSVLVEKPAALTVSDAQALAAAATAGNASLAVGFIRREAVAVRAAKECLDTGILGEIKEFSIEDGYPFSWNAVNEFRFDKARGGGILFDIGSHILDLLTYWFGEIHIKRFRDDSMGGVETNAFIDIETAHGGRGTAELSWTRTLRNSAKLIGTRASLEVEWYTNRACLTLGNQLHELPGRATADRALQGGAEVFPLMFLSQLQRWYGSLVSEALDTPVMAGAADAIRNIELIARCQGMRAELDLPWRNARN